MPDNIVVAAAVVNAWSIRYNIYIIRNISWNISKIYKQGVCKNKYSAMQTFRFYLVCFRCKIVNDEKWWFQTDRTTILDWRCSNTPRQMRQLYIIGYNKLVKQKKIKNTKANFLILILRLNLSCCIFLFSFLDRNKNNNNKFLFFNSIFIENFLHQSPPRFQFFNYTLSGEKISRHFRECSSCLFDDANYIQDKRKIL